MEGQNEKVEQESRVVNSKAIEISEAPEQPIKAPEQQIEVPKEVQGESEEEYPEEEYPEDYEEEYPEEEYPEDYESDEDWQGETDSPDPPGLGGLYGLFKYTIKKPDSKRVSNLTNEELGSWNLSLRDCERIALIADTFRHPGVAKFFINQSRIISDTAMSRKGWLTELFITSKKFASRDTSSSIQNLPQFSKKSKWRMFSDRGSQPVQEPA